MLGPAGDAVEAAPPGSRDPVLAAWRAQVEGPAFQHSGADVVLGGGGFADDRAPADAVVQLGADAPLAPDLRAARAETGRVQGRNSTVPLTAPVPLPAGEWSHTLQTTWVEPGLRRARRQLEPPRREAGLAAGQRRCLRGQAPQPRAGGRPGAGRRDRSAGPRAVAPRGRGAPRPQATTRGHRAAPGRHRGGARRPECGLGRPGAGARAGGRAVSRGRDRGGGGGRAAGVARAARRGVGGGAGGADRGARRSRIGG